MLRPTKDWVVTKPLPVIKETITASGLVIATPPSETKLVEIISFGPDANPDSSLKAGDIVMVLTKTGITTEHEDVIYEMAKPHNFLGVIEKVKTPIYEDGSPDPVRFEWR